jgi:hypothetical protein
MRKKDNDWHVEEDHEHDHNLKYQPSIVEINGEKYHMPEHFAGLAHAILLLVDAINHKSLSNE